MATQSCDLRIWRELSAPLQGPRRKSANGKDIADKSSRQDLLKNADGSIDVYVGPDAPAGKEKNWIPSVPGKAWFAYLRLYGPLQPYFDRAFALPDFEQVK